MLMKREAEAPPQSGRLESWKEIASYLRRGARTVQRWEREEGLPVHRLQHDKLGSVYAYPSELDAWFQGRAGPPTKPAPAPSPATASVAVLPFTDMSREGDQGYFCDGIADEIIHALTPIKALRTASRTSSFRFRWSAIDIRGAARELGVGALLEGSVRKCDDRLRITVQLVDAETGFQLWTERYDRTVRDIFEIQDEIAESVLHALKVTLTRTEEASLFSAPTRDIKAYDCYLRGRNFYYAYSPKSMQFALKMFLEAIRLDPDYARAYAGLADCWSYVYLYSDRSEAVREQADWASRKALEMDPQSAQALASRGLSLSLSGRNDEADQAFAAAMRLDPDLFETHYFRARHCFALGRREEAIEAYEAAMRARPDDFQAPLLAAQTYDDLGRHAEAAEARRKGVAAAERRIQLNPDDARALYMAANGLVALGERDRGRRYADAALAVSGEDPMLLYNLGCIYSMLGAIGQALDCLEKAAASGLTQKSWYEHDSNLDPLRNEARFLRLMELLDAR